MERQAVGEDRVETSLDQHDEIRPQRYALLYARGWSHGRRAAADAASCAVAADHERDTVSKTFQKSQLGDLCLAWCSFTAVPFPHARALPLNITGIGKCSAQRGTRCLWQVLGAARNKVPILSSISVTIETARRLSSNRGSISTTRRSRLSLDARKKNSSSITVKPCPRNARPPAKTVDPIPRTRLLTSDGCFRCPSLPMADVGYGAAVTGLPPRQ